MSITQRKSNLRGIIHKKVAAYLAEHPEEAAGVAMGAIRRLSSKMTLAELEQWHTVLFLSETIAM